MSDYPGASLAPMGAYQEKGLNPRPATQREILLQRKSELEDRLDRVNDALNQLDKHPEFEQVMNAVLKANY